MLGFHPREYEGAATWRWMGQTGALRIVATRASAENVLELELKAFPRARRVGWLVRGRRMGEVEVGPVGAGTNCRSGPWCPGRPPSPSPVRSLPSSRKTSSTTATPVPWAWRWGAGESSRVSRTDQYPGGRTRRLMSPMLHEFLTLHRDEIIARTREKVATRTAPRPTDAELEHGVPLFLDQLAETLRRRAGDRGATDQRGDGAQRAHNTAASCGGPASPLPRSSTTTGTSARR